MFDFITTPNTSTATLECEGGVRYSIMTITDAELNACVICSTVTVGPHVVRATVITKTACLLDIFDQ